MKRLIFLIPLILFSCKTSKSTCDAYGELVFPYQDTLIFPYEHIHIESLNQCYEFPQDTCIIRDTIIIKYKKI